jgi:oligoendopeptidase F
MAQKPRSEVAPEDTWRVEMLYAQDADWETDFVAIQQYPERIAAFQGRLAQSAAVLAEALAAFFQAMRQTEKVYVYAHLRHDEDLGNATYQNMMERAYSAFVRLDTAGSYLSPEILAIDDQQMAEWMAGEALLPYRVWLEDLLRSRPHTLSPAEERLLAMAAEPLGSFEKVYGVLKNVELAARLPSVKDESGEEQQLSHALFIKLQENRDRTVRKAAFDAYYAEWAGNRQTVAATLDGALKAHVFSSQARRFGSSLEATLFGDNVEVAVYDALIGAVHAALPAFYRYVALRRRLLGVSALHMYDAYVPVVPAVDLTYTYDQAVALVCEAMAPLGAEYVEVMQRGLREGWVDRYENAGKRSGAYSSGCYDSVPYILMNYTGTLDAMFTLAHELGHSMHSWLSNHHQPYHLADYRLLVAEVASTANESLLTEHLLAHTDDRTVRAYLVDRYLDSFRATLFRQTMFAEFEKRIYAQVEGGEPLTADSLDASYYDLVKMYFGDTVAFDQEDRAIAYEWSRVDHFFYNFYVYKYATGMSAAIALTSRIRQQGAPAVAQYLTFLQSGRVKYPLDLLRDAGVDLADPATVQSALAEFERLVGELETLMA